MLSLQPPPCLTTTAYTQTYTRNQSFPAERTLTFPILLLKTSVTGRPVPRSLTQAGEGSPRFQVAMEEIVNRILSTNRLTSGPASTISSNQNTGRESPSLKQYITVSALTIHTGNAGAEMSLSSSTETHSTRSIAIVVNVSTCTVRRSNGQSSFPR